MEKEEKEEQIKEQIQHQEDDYQTLAFYLVRVWNDVTILLILVLCIWVACFAEIAPLWSQEIPDSIDWSCMVASIMTGTAVLFEFTALVVEYSPSKLPSSVNTDDSKTMLFAYTCLSVSYFKMAVSGNQWVHTDPLAIGGPRPVYTLRYLEWSIAMPLLISITGADLPDENEGEQSPPTAEKWKKNDETSNMLAQHINMLVNLPLVVGERLLSAPLAASARCTAAYIWSSWLAVIVTDEFSRWLLLSLSFGAYGVATIQQATYWWFIQKSKDKNAGDFCTLVLTEALLATHYGIIYLLAVFGCISCQTEQVAYTYSDVLAKLFHSMYLVSLRRRKNLMILEELRAGSQLAAADLQRMISQANVPIFCVDKELQIEDWNQKIEELTGVSRADALHRHLPEFYNTQSTSWWNDAGQLLENTLKGEDSSVVEMQFTGGPGAKICIVAVSATCQRTAKGEIRGAVCIGQDVTELTMEKQRAQNLAESLERLIHSANAPIFEIDLELRIVRWNSWLANTCGVSLAELMGKPISEVLSQRSKKPLKDAVSRALSQNDNSSETFEIGLVDEGENLRATLLVTATPALSPFGQIVGTVCVGQDITAIKDLESRKASIMAMLSHELKSPLHGITGLSSSLLDDSEVPGMVKKPLAMMQNCAKRLLDMVSNIMDASVLVHDKKMRMSKDKVQLQSIVEEVITLARQSSGEVGSHSLSPGVKLVNAVTTPLPIIVADAHRITQLIYNLVTNAIKFTHQGRITVSGSYDDEKGEVYIEVNDTGIGIAPQNIDRIFQPFDQEDSSESRRYGGLGLGLAISREVVAKHGGELSVKSQPGKGSTFRVLLPYHMPEDPAMEDGHGSSLLAAPTAERTFTSPSHMEEIPIESIEQAEKVDTTSTGGMSIMSMRSRTSGTKSMGQNKSKKGLVMMDRVDIEDLVLQMKVSKSYAERIPSSSSVPVVLSVDDDSIHQQIIASVLRPCGYEVVECLSVGQCIQYLRIVGNLLPSLILLDVMMPGINGMDFLKALRKLYPLEILPVIMISAKSNKDTIAGCLQEGANDYIQKPFDKKELLQRVRNQQKISNKERENCQAQRLGRQRNSEEEQKQQAVSSVQGIQQSEIPSVSEGAANWLQIAAEEMKSLREERDGARQEASELRSQVKSLEETLKSEKGLEEQQRQVKNFLTRQKALATQQDQLTVFMEQLEIYQKIQRQLVCSKANEDMRLFSAPVAMSIGQDSQGPVVESLKELQIAEHVLHASLSKMTEISNLMTGDVKEEMQKMIATLRKDMGNLLMNMGRKCYLLLDAQSKLQDQALQIQRVMMPQLANLQAPRPSAAAM